MLFRSFGLEPRAAIDEAGLCNTIALRASQGGGSRLRDPREYIDLSYYTAALALAKPQAPQHPSGTRSPRVA